MGFENLNHDVIGYLKNDIRNSIINDIKDVADFHFINSKSKPAGFYSIPREVFAYVDFISMIAYGKNSTENAIKFIEEYFPENYKMFGATLYCMWRHGTIHEYQPKKLCSDTGIYIRWETSIDKSLSDKILHLKYFYENNNKREVIVRVNIHALVDDLIFALDEFVLSLEGANISEEISAVYDKSIFRYRKVSDTRWHPDMVKRVNEQIIDAQGKSSKR